MFILCMDKLLVGAVWEEKETSLVRKDAVCWSNQVFNSNVTDALQLISTWINHNRDYSQVVDVNETN